MTAGSKALPRARGTLRRWAVPALALGAVGTVGAVGQAAAGPAPNLVPNPSFESGTPGTPSTFFWQGFNSAALIAAPGGPHTGLRAVEATSLADGAFSINPSPKIIISPGNNPQYDIAGRPLVASAYVKAGNPAAVGKVATVVISENGVDHEGSHVTLSSTWQPTTLSYTIAQTGSSIGVTVKEKGATAKAGDALDVDDVSLVGNQPPLADFTSSSGPTAGQPVSFSAATSDAEGDAVGDTWSFGDGAVGSGPSADHTYAAPGLYSVTLTASDGQGAPTVISRTIAVAAAPVLAPTPPAGAAPVAPIQVLAGVKDTIKPSLTHFVVVKKGHKRFAHFTTSEAATFGYRLDRRALAAKGKAGRGKPAFRLLRRRSSVSLAAGPQSVALGALAKGTYRITLNLADPSANAIAPVKTFTIR